MQRILLEYLILHKNISLPGIGKLSLEQQSASLNIAEKIINPPFYQIRFDRADDKPVKRLFTWISSVMQVTEWDAIRSVNDFAFEIRRSLSDSGESSWSGAGIFRRNERGEIIFESMMNIPEGMVPVIGEKVIRKQVNHIVKVGEEERTSSQMEELLAAAEPRKDHGWQLAVILAIILIMFTGWYFSEKGQHPQVTGNRSVISTAK